MKGLSYTLRLIEPVLVKSLEGDINSAQSQGYIPGSVVRGALVSEYLKEKKIVNIDATEKKFRSLFLNNDTRYLHAFPDGDGKRSIPIPLSWKIKKGYSPEENGSAADVFDISQELPEEDDLKPVGGVSYWKREENTIYINEPPFQTNIHNQRDPVKGRATEQHGAIFRFEALASGLLFRGIILSEDEENLNVLMKLMSNKEVMLGKSRTAGYGRAKIEDVDDLSLEYREEWYWKKGDSEEGFDEDDEENDVDQAENDPTETEIHRFTIHFHSAALIRDNRGQYSLDPRAAIETCLGCKLKEKGIFRKGEIIGGFNRTWGLQLPQVMAIAPGSVFVYEAESSVSKKRLRKLEETGLGERKSEGFGELLVHGYIPDSFEWDNVELEEPSTDINGVALTNKEKELAERMLKRMLRKELDAKLLEAVPNNQIKGDLTNSQISRLRILIRDGLGRDNPLENLERHINKNKSSGKSFYNVRVGSDKKRLTRWFEDIFKGKNAPWEQMKYNRPPSRQLGPSIRVSAKEFENEYKLRLLDAVLADLAKRNRRNS